MAENKKTKAHLAELRNMQVGDLSDAIESARKNIYSIRRQRISKPVENVKAIRTNRKEIARILTILKQRGETPIVNRPAAPAATGKKKAAAR